MNNTDKTQAPLIVHVIYQLGVGGLENGLINIINTMQADAYRHTIICLTYSTDFEKRLTRSDVQIYSLHKQAGQDWGSFVKMYRLLKQLKPSIVHTRNLSAIEYQIPALLAGVKHRIHSEHGWDVFDPDGNNKKYQWLRRLMKPFIGHFIALSKQLEDYLTDKIHVLRQKITRICNGVDTARFYPRENGIRTPLPNCPHTLTDETLVIGTVGRMHGVKDQITLVKAFIQICNQEPELKSRLKLFLIGDGPLRQIAIELLQEQQLQDLAWLPGERSDIAEIMRQLDIFVLPSQAEGISNTILEAMATGLPVIATDVGGNSELVVEQVTGLLTAPGDSDTMASKILDYIHHSDMRNGHGRQAYQRILATFSLTSMVNQYQSVYAALNPKD